MKTSYTNTKLITEGPTKFQKILKYALYLAALVMVVAAIVTIISFSNKEDDSQAALPAFPYGTLNELTNPAAFMQAYLSVNCNATLLESTQTIRVAGVMESGDTTRKFTLIKKRPDRLLFKMKQDALNITIGVNNGNVWRIIRAPQRDDLVTLIEGDEATQWLGQRRFFDRIISASLGDGTITGIATAEWDAQTCLEVTTQTKGETAQTLVDPKTMYPLVERQTMPDGSIQRTVSSDFRDVQGMPIAFTIESFTDDTLDSRIRINSAALNTGLLSQLFEVPDALKPPAIPSQEDTEPAP
ncbi:MULTISPECIES: hypothetical protein [unclassified Lentimonas]|uniref:hypothetical protein n=1 Tax=unclassified Lentimonas TaxID=2630993 RepID=UPI001323C7F4|nr:MULTISPECIES: hypothetical protein [unclassified Lentimonas]CAA6679717.1 Unannotated [Lentimonas sp. CC4]CAA6683517.1 Unannotated [Lentimonas sp. CC6]CAA7077278.1 Unannotated [Lentimonas sp. CC4]CAA7171420.1 Unannotated [Lentimonas sp. CC21]CAA7182406.1 Unannotated [Lentimonas sp. CC8]